MADAVPATLTALHMKLAPSKIVRLDTLRVLSSDTYEKKDNR